MIIPKEERDRWARYASYYDYQASCPEGHLAKRRDLDVAAMIRALLAGEPVAFEGAEQADKPAPRPQPTVALEPLDLHPQIGAECSGCDRQATCVAVFGPDYKCGVCDECAQAVADAQPVADRREVFGHAA